jgi:response regulator NasT
MNLPASLATEPAAAGSKGRILVVDDDRLVLATLVQGLTDAGYEVIDADNGDEAILFAREHRPQLALLDIRMVGKTGFDVARTLRDPKYGIPFMFLSAFADEATQREVQALGALDYLIKPLDVGQIVPRVDAAFARVAAGNWQATPGALPDAVGTSGAVLAPAAPGGGAMAAPVAPATDPLAHTEALAVGVLMHRHGLTRQAAWQQLRKLAQAQGMGTAAQAERLIAALEELARSAP